MTKNREFREKHFYTLFGKTAKFCPMAFLSKFSKKNKKITACTSQITWVVHFLYYPFFNMYILFYIFSKFLSPKKILVQKFPNILQKNVHFFTTLLTEFFWKKPRFFRKKLAHFFPILTNCTKKIMAEKKQKFLKKYTFYF